MVKIIGQSVPVGQSVEPLTLRSVWRSLSVEEKAELVMVGVPYAIELSRWVIKGFAKVVAMELNAQIGRRY